MATSVSVAIAPRTTVRCPPPTAATLPTGRRRHGGGCRRRRHRRRYRAACPPRVSLGGHGQATGRGVVENAHRTWSNVRSGGAVRFALWSRARRPLAVGRRVAVCGGGSIRTLYSPVPRTPSPPPHREWRCIGGGAAAVGAAVTATVEAAGDATERRQQRGAWKNMRLATGGRASAISAYRVQPAGRRAGRCGTAAAGGGEGGGCACQPPRPLAVGVCGCDGEGGAAAGDVWQQHTSVVHRVAVAGAAAAADSRR